MEIILFLSPSPEEYMASQLPPTQPISSPDKEEVPQQAVQAKISQHESKTDTQQCAKAPGKANAPINTVTKAPTVYKFAKPAVSQTVPKPSSNIKSVPNASSIITSVPNPKLKSVAASSSAFSNDLVKSPLKVRPISSVNTACRSSGSLSSSSSNNKNISNKNYNSSMNSNSSSNSKSISNNSNNSSSNNNSSINKNSSSSNGVSRVAPAPSGVSQTARSSTPLSRSKSSGLQRGSVASQPVSRSVSQMEKVSLASEERVSYGEGEPSFEGALLYNNMMCDIFLVRLKEHSCSANMVDREDQDETKRIGVIELI